MADLFLDALRRHVAQFDTQKDAAASLGISGAYLGDLLKGKRGASDRVLRALGLTRTVRRLTPTERDEMAVAK